MRTLSLRANTLTYADIETVQVSRVVRTCLSEELHNTLTEMETKGPMKNIINNAYSTAGRPFNKITAANNSNFTKKVNTVKGTRVNIARPKAVISVVKRNKRNVVKASACWVWRPKHKVLDHGNPQQDLKNKRVIDSGCSRHMTGNRSYLTDYKEIDGGFVAFGGNSKGGKITRKGKARIETEEKKDAEDLGNESGNPTEGKDSEVPSTEEPRINQEKDDNINNTNNVNVVSSTVNAAGIEVNVVDLKTSIEVLNDLNMPEFEDIIYSDDDEDVGAEANMNNLDAFIPVSPILTTRIHKDHLVEQIIGDLHSTPQIRRMTKNLEEHGLFSSVQQRINHKDFQNCLFTCFLSQEEPKKVSTLVDLPNGKRAIGTKWVYKNKKDERGIVIKNKMDVKSDFLCQPLGFEDPDFPDRRGKIDKTLFIRRVKSDILLVQVYVDDIIFGSTKKSLCIEFEKMMHKKFQMSSMGELTFFLGLQMKQKEDGIFISQDKYVTEILKKFGFTDVKTASTPMETQNHLLKDAYGEDVDEHLYRSMIRSLMYLTYLRPDIMFAVCACARYQVNLKVSHLYAVKRIFRYLKGQPKLGLWYLKDSLFDSVAYTDSNYAGESLDRKSTTGGIGVNAGDSKLMLLSINLLLLEKVNAARHNLLLLAIDSLKRRVKKLEKKKGSRTHKLKRLYKVGRSAGVVSSEDEGLGDQEDVSKQGRKIDEINQDAEVTLVDETQGRYGDNLMFDTGVLDNEQDMAEKEVDIAEKDAVTTAATTTTTAVIRPKARGVMVQEPNAELEEEEERLARQREEDAKIVEWDNVQAMMDAYYKLAARLQAEEQGELNVEENIVKLKTTTLEDIHMLFDKREMKRVNTYVDIDTELGEKAVISEKDTVNCRSGVVDDQEEVVMNKAYGEIVPDVDGVSNWMLTSCHYAFIHC
ncbi:putative ribonuclease H-like domain-containing protein [Tanacetum coccineum]|uniref:Ribonuclease H-like domain-containing protein n=1 Tax=Tanacetum coccineum TaxID=301880 RepID=A0ABQ4ZXK9_9ASTR